MSSEPEKSEPGSSMYVGLSPAQRLWIVAGAIFVVACSLVFSAVIMSGSLGDVQFNSSDQQAVENISGGISNEMHRAVLRAHAIDAITNLKLVANKQAIIIVAFAAAMALVAVGFALFLIGADGAFKLNAQTGGGAGGAKLVFSGTAPGLLCVLLAAILIGMGIAHRSRLDLGSVSFPVAQGKPDDSKAALMREKARDSALEALKGLAGAPGSLPKEKP